jgi:hypothetical protein
MYQQKLKTAREIASFLNIPKNKFTDHIRVTNEENAMLYIDDVRGLNNYAIYCSDVCIKKLVLTPEKFCKSPAAEEWGVGKCYLDPKSCEQRYVMSLRWGDDLFIMRSACAYEGKGGIFIRDTRWSWGGYILEPIRHWLIDVLGEPEVERRSREMD